GAAQRHRRRRLDRAHGGGGRKINRRWGLVDEAASFVPAAERRSWQLRLRAPSGHAGGIMKPPSLTIGIEEEYQIIDPQTRELKSYITQILEDSKLILKEQVKAELHQSMVEVGTEVCHTPTEDREFLIDAMNVARYFVPHVLCLSASSPFWMGRNTGLQSYRSIIFRHFPRTGTPPSFSSWAELSGLVDTLVKTNCIPDGSKL